MKHLKSSIQNLIEKLHHLLVVSLNIDSIPGWFSYTANFHSGFQSIIFVSFEEIRQNQPRKCFLIAHDLNALLYNMI